MKTPMLIEHHELRALVIAVGRIHEAGLKALAAKDDLQAYHHAKDGTEKAVNDMLLAYRRWLEVAF